MNNEHVMVTRSSCNDCVHKSVCSYKEEFHDVCNAVAGADVHKYMMDKEKVKITNVLAYKDILDEIVIKCKHYYNGEKIRVDSNGITIQTYPPVTNPCDDLSTSQTATDPRLWAGVYTTAHN